MVRGAIWHARCIGAYFRWTLWVADSGLGNQTKDSMPAILILCFIVSLVWLKWPLLAYLLIFVALIVTEWWLAYPGRVIDRPQQPKPRSALNTMIGVGLGSLLVVFAPLGVWVVMDPLKAGRWLGGLGVLFVAVMLFANLTVLYRRGHERLATGRSSKWMPRVLTGIALLVGYLAVSGAYNEAPVRRHVKPATDPAPRQTAAQYIDRWLAERVSVDQKSGERVPVFIVAAEGGGIRAGYWTAGVLAGIHDRFPQFSDHTLALSGVSGGNVGVGTYAALLKAKQAWGAGSSPSCYGKNKLQACASEVLGADLLAAPLGAMLLGDVWRSMTSLTAFRASGSSIPDPPKRSPLLEQSLEQAFADATGQHTLSEPWQSLWTDTPARIPFVISNLTHVNTTSRVVVTPFKPGKT